MALGTLVPYLGLRAARPIEWPETSWRLARREALRARALAVSRGETPIPMPSRPEPTMLQHFLDSLQSKLSGAVSPLLSERAASILRWLSQAHQCLFFMCVGLVSVQGIGRASCALSACIY